MKEKDEHALCNNDNNYTKDLTGVDAELTWRELKIVNSHATTVEFALTTRVPNAHVSPRRGSRIRDASRRALQ